MPRFRKHLRLPHYDYSAAGAYFVTLCTARRQHLLGEIVADELRLSAIGKEVRRCWLDIPAHFPHWALDEWVLMPNHLHAVLWREDPHEDGRAAVLGAVIGGFKSACTRWAVVATQFLGACHPRRTSAGGCAAVHTEQSSDVGPRQI